MIRKEVISSLTDEELGILLHLTNEVHPPGFNLKVNENLLTTYKKQALIEICAHYRDKIKEEFTEIYDTMVAKLNGHVNVTKKDDTTKTPEPKLLDDKPAS